MNTLLRWLFAPTVQDEATNIRESIKRDNLRGILGDPHFMRGEGMTDFERDQRRRHVVREEVRA